ncbi:MAG: hypothetical protein QOI10_1043, partial [Solirubrobacterales bacterium]|nr:hypothetical protein [Solirubrobacterales bacterium]
SGVTPGDNFDVCLDLGQNFMTGSGTHGGTDFRLRQRQNTAVKLLGYTGGAFDTAAVTSYVQSKLGGAPTGVATTDAGEGFTGGASCP